MCWVGWPTLVTHEPGHMSSWCPGDTRVLAELMFDWPVCQVTSCSLEVKSCMESTKGRSHTEGWGEVLSQQAGQTNDEWVKTTLQVITRREVLLRSCLQSLIFLPFLSERIVSTMNCARSIIKRIHLGSCYICCASKQYFPWLLRRKI